MSDARTERGAGRDVITIDGPAASGKSSVAERVAGRLGIPFVSSGLLYRAAAHVAVSGGLDPAEPEPLLARLEASDVQLRPAPEGNRVTLAGRDVTEQLHTDEVDATVSTVAAHPSLRAWVDARLRELPGPFVIDGRDMGSVVFPHARHKFYLTATPETRAGRRVGERDARLDDVARALRQRDARDARQLAPAADAVTIDTDRLPLDEVVERVLERVGSAAFR